MREKMKHILIVLLLLVVILCLCGCIKDGFDDKKDVSEFQGVLYEYNSKTLDSKFGFMHPEHFEEMNDLGVSWHRPHSGPFNWGKIEKSSGSYVWEEADYEVIRSQYYGLNILATIWPFADWDQSSCNQQLPSSDTGNFFELGKYRGKPCDISAYNNFVQELVERYDGDGVDDMPDLLVPIKYWEVSNEPSMQHELVFFKGTSSDYFDILKATYEAVKKADASAFVVSGGMAGVMTENLEFWQDVFDLGGGSYFDIGNIHSISSDSDSFFGNDYDDFLVQNSLNKSFWTTEAELSSFALKGKSPSEEAFAEVLVKTFVGAFESGSEKVFYVGLEQCPGDEESWLIGKHDQKQAAYYSFKTMVDKIDYFDSVEKLGEGQYKFMIDEHVVYVVWGNNNIPEEITGQVKMTDIDGTVTLLESSELNLDDIPVFLEIL
jgi:hypothetical protein